MAGKKVLNFSLNSQLFNVGSSKYLRPNLRRPYSLKNVELLLRPKIKINLKFESIDEAFQKFNGFF